VRDQLRQPDVEHPAKPLQGRDFERLDDHAATRTIEPVPAQRPGQEIDRIDARLLQQEAGVFEFGVKADPPPGFGLLHAHKLDDLVKRGHLIEAVVSRVGRTDRGNALKHAQHADFSQGEILGKPAGHALPVDGLFAAAALEFLARGDIGGVRKLVFMARDQYQIARDNQVGLDEIGALIDRPFIGCKRMLRPFGAGAAMRDDLHVRPRSRSRLSEAKTDTEAG